jgi:hypothetical protein
MSSADRALTWKEGAAGGAGAAEACRREKLLMAITRKRLLKWNFIGRYL